MEQARNVVNRLYGAWHFKFKLRANMTKFKPRKEFREERIGILREADVVIGVYTQRESSKPNGDKGGEDGSSVEKGTDDGSITGVIDDEMLHRLERCLVGWRHEYYFLNK
ncbi:hypothetical protein ES288_A02G006000v1 [Gossypium darwinii]|uniref:Uncharacterized protein n=1 Tax=Gossypium darwinii TaxID=34276 RepID=A0A5D2H8L1_GOSDA|nr:hypothetical protein ES288_A02G006000v1 [Gossypium darwinii]